VIIGLIAWAVFYILNADPTGVASLGDRRIPATLAAGAGGDEGGVIDGRQVYTTTCQACHQATGQGLPGVFPPLAGTPWVTGDANTPIQIVLHGLTGPIEVAGTTYNGAMPGFGGQLSDAQIAAVLTFIRSEWGNTSPAVDEATVKEARAATAAQAEPWANVDDIPAAGADAASEAQSS
jgi:mono/diheme cytochrome c family protein